MFKFLSRLVSFGAKPVATKDQDAKAWLDELRQNELSISARRRIAPDEPVKAPSIAHGSALPVAAPAFGSTSRGNVQKPAPTSSAPESVYVSSDLTSTDSSACDSSASDSASCGGDSD